MILFFDTETTGIYDFRLPPDHEAQPHVVQLAAVLVEPIGAPNDAWSCIERASLSLIIDCDGFSIPAGAAAIHGITEEVARRCGVPLVAALYAFICLRSQASLLVAHNSKFDLAMIEASLMRIPKRNFHPGPQRTFCTMEAAAPIIDLPPTERMKAAGIDKPKAPKLEEAYAFFTGSPLTKAHDALGDVRATIEIFRHLQIRGVTSNANS